MGPAPHHCLAVSVLPLLAPAAEIPVSMLTDTK